MNDQPHIPKPTFYPHPSQEQLQEYLDRELGSQAAANLESHLESCPPCREVLKQFQGLDQNLKSLPSIPSNRDFSIPVLAAVREERSRNRGLTWTAVLQAAAAGVILGVALPALRTAGWFGEFSSFQVDLISTLNLFFSRLLGEWLLWWTTFQIDAARLLSTWSQALTLDYGTISPWVIILIAGTLGLLANGFLLPDSPLQKLIPRKH